MGAGQPPERLDRKRREHAGQRWWRRGGRCGVEHDEGGKLAARTVRGASWRLGYPTISLKPSPMASCTLLMMTIAAGSMLFTMALRSSISLRESTT